MQTNSPFFIVGSSRSGTTLLRLLLCGHSRLHIPPETWFIAPLVARFPLTGTFDTQQTRQVVEVMLAHPRWPDLDIPAEDLRAWAAALPAPTLADLIGLPYRHHLARAGKPRFGDKTPPYIAIVPQLATLYPSARFIHLIRDGRDVAVSFIDAGFHGRAYHGARFEWTRAVRLGEAWRRVMLADRFIEVRYEDLVRDPEAALRRICACLGEAFEPAMLDWRARIALVPAKERRIHAKLARPIDGAAAQTWRQRLSGPECFLMEAALRHDLRRLGYQLRFAGAAWRPALAATGLLLRATAPLLDRAIPALQRRGLLGARQV
jgi:Sulfotransferase family